jgi:hypothetical protein
VTKIYGGDTPAVNDVSLDIDAETQVTEGSDPELWLDPSRMHLFDPESGENLTLRHGIRSRTLASA